MDKVGARLGRSSNRYAPRTTLFTGPVHIWKKKWIHRTPPSFGNCNRPTDNGGVNGSNDSHLLLFKWTPSTSSQNRNDAANSSAKDDGFIAEEPPKRKFMYIPPSPSNKDIAIYLSDVVCFPVWLELLGEYLLQFLE